jgi:hypothetical protein
MYQSSSCEQGREHQRTSIGGGSRRPATLDNVIKSFATSERKYVNARFQLSKLAEEKNMEQRKLRNASRKRWKHRQRGS